MRFRLRYTTKWKRNLAKMSNSPKNNNGLLRLLGLAARAGKLVYGTPMVCEALKKADKICLVFVAKNASANTKKRIGDRCDFYKKQLVELDIDTVELGRVLGKSGELAVVGLADNSFKEGIKKFI